MNMVRSKAELRQQAHARRRQQADKDSLSREMMGRFFALPEYQAARTVLFYLDVRDEARTRFTLGDALTSGKKVVVPWCNALDRLELFHLESLEELSIGRYRILEPRIELRLLPGKQVSVQQIDLALVPGVAFDRRGARLGHGKGYYDKLLAHARPETPLVGLAFECQLFLELPVEPHDVLMDKIVTEAAVYRSEAAGVA